MLGRTFTRRDDSPGAPQTVMLAYGYWQQRFGGDPAVLGRLITLDGKPRQIIGVTPRDSRFMGFQPLLILPFQMDRGKVFIGEFSYRAVARLRTGITLAAANADVARMLPLMSAKFPPAPGMNLKMIEEARIGPDGDGRDRVVHRLRQCRESAAGAGGRAPAGTGGPGGAGRRLDADCA